MFAPRLEPKIVAYSTRSQRTTDAPWASAESKPTNTAKLGNTLDKFCKARMRQKCLSFSRRNSRW
jgi:hypothetical protein